MSPLPEVVCPYCRQNAVLVDSIAVYHRSYGMIWLCRPCEAWVGVHKGDGKNLPLGTLANAELRRCRQLAHQQLDPFWEKLISDGIGKWKARSQVYARLAKALGIDRNECHIAMFDARRCHQVMDICSKWQRAAAEAAAQQPEST